MAITEMNKYRVLNIIVYRANYLLCLYCFYKTVGINISISVSQSLIVSAIYTFGVFFIQTVEQHVLGSAIFDYLFPLVRKN